MFLGTCCGLCVTLFRSFSTKIWLYYIRIPKKKIFIVSELWTTFSLAFILTWSETNHSWIHFQFCVTADNIVSSWILSNGQNQNVFDKQMPCKCPCEQFHRMNTLPSRRRFVWKRCRSTPCIALSRFLIYNITLRRDSRFSVQRWLLFVYYYINVLH